MNAPFYRKMEIAVWDLIIENLTNSNAIRAIVKELANLKQSQNLGLYSAVIVMGGAFGFFLGLAIPQILIYMQ
ncbi:MAG: hypothetical protein ACYC6H_11010 [Bellilinea sp.]|jgi:hypothetical protein